MASVGAGKEVEGSKELEMTSRKRTRKGEGWKGRKGVYLREGRSRFVVEMRVLPSKQELKLHFGSYGTEPEAMVARDYGAFLRAEAGENRAVAGGFRAEGAEDKLYQFEEVHEIFESMEETKVRRDQYKSLITQQSNELHNAVYPSVTEFNKQARNDILVAIGKFRDRYPHKLVTSQPAEAPIQEVDSGICFTQPSSSSEVRVSPVLELGGESIAMAGVAASSLSMPVQIAVAVNGSSSLLDTKVYQLSEREVWMIVEHYMAKIKRKVLNHDALAKALEEAGPCPINPLSIPALHPAPKT